MTDQRAELIAAIGKQLGELNEGFLRQVDRIIDQLGPERVAVLVRTVVRLEQLGGCLVLLGHRRRTPGGLFIILARGCMSQDQRGAVWPEYAKREAADDVSAASPASKMELETGARKTGKAIIAPVQTVVNETAERRHNAPTPRNY